MTWAQQPQSKCTTILKVLYGILILGAVCLLCNETYHMWKVYKTEPTAIEMVTVKMNKFPPIQIFLENWWDDTAARKLGFSDGTLTYLTVVFDSWQQSLPMEYYGGDPLAEEKRAQVKALMEKNGLSTVEDILGIVSFKWNIPGATVSPPKWYFGGYSCRYTINMNQDYRGEDVLIPLPRGKYGTVVVGEDRYGQAYRWHSPYYGNVSVNVIKINKVVSLNKNLEYCNSQYNSKEACIDDCGVAQMMCRANISSSLDYNRGSFWALADYQIDRWMYMETSKELADQCANRAVACRSKCNLCTTWWYETTSDSEFAYYNSHDYNSYYYNNYNSYYYNNYNYNDNDNNSTFYLKISTVGKMKVSREYYTHSLASILAHVGGLVFWFLFCGIVVLLAVQLLMSCFSKRRVDVEKPEKA